MLSKLKHIISFGIFITCYLIGLATEILAYNILDLFHKPNDYISVLIMSSCSAMGIYFGIKLSLNFYKNVTEQAERKQNHD